MIGKWIKTDNWYRERKKDPNYFDERSFRTKKSNDHMITFGCKKGFWNDKNQLCKIGVEIQAILHPLKESMHENPQVCLLVDKKMKNNPNKKWHKEMAEKYFNLLKYAKESNLNDYDEGQIYGQYLSHLQSKMHKVKKNPQKKMKKNPNKKWYFGDIIGKYSMVKIFSSVSTPTEESHGKLYKFVTGPFKTKKAAINAAVYRGTIK